MECRDWLKTLWSASYKGVPFYFESDEEEGGRDVIVHLRPKSDQPYLEDMGEAARYFSGAAYVVGSDVDALEMALKGALVSQGAGVLTVPLAGPVIVRAMNWTRRHERDKLGYVAFQIKFVREGAASAFTSIPFALNQAFGAAETLAASLVSSFAASVSLLGRPDFVVAAVSDGIAGAAAALDVARTSYRTDPGASAVIRDTLAAIVETAAVMPADQSVAETTALAQSLVDSARAIADALPPESAVRAMLEVAGQFDVVVASPAYATQNVARAAMNAAAVARLARLAALTAYAESILRLTFPARPDGVAARASVAERFERELYALNGAETAPLARAIDDLRGRVIEYLSARINDLAPLVNVVTPRGLPSLVLAYRLYADPRRASELAARNLVRHPSFMPAEIVALAT